MIKCIVIDDEPLALNQVAAYVEKTPFLELSKRFESAFDALDWLNNHTVDLIYLDINMPDLTGLEFLKSLSNPPKVIFTTAYSEYALDGFKLDAVDYLLKPFSYSDFLKASQKAKDRFFTTKPATEQLESNEEFLFIKTEYKLQRVNFKDIKYIEGMREYVRIYLDNQPPVMTLLSMKKLAEHLPDKDFMRVHRSFIVNLHKINTIERNRIIFDKDVYIPVSEQKKEEFQKFLEQNFLK